MQIVPLLSRHCVFGQSESTDLRLVSGPSDTTVIPGQRVTFNCTISGSGWDYFFHQVIWYKVRSILLTQLLQFNSICFIVNQTNVYNIVINNDTFRSVVYNETIGKPKMDYGHAGEGHLCITQFKRSFLVY